MPDLSSKDGFPVSYLWATIHRPTSQIPHLIQTPIQSHHLYDVESYEEQDGTVDD